jgi:hypothetical protein
MVVVRDGMKKVVLSIPFLAARGVTALHPE